MGQIKIARKKFIRAIAIADPHCGSISGLTPSDYVLPKELYDYQDRRDELWNEFATRCKKYKPFDVCMALGDLVQGPHVPRANSETIVTAPRKQQAIAEKVFEFIGAPHGVIVHGTPWHVGEDDIEPMIAKKMQYEFHKQINMYPVGKVNFNLKHKVGGGSMAHTIGNTLMAEFTAALLNDKNYGTGVADVFLRGHKHLYHRREVKGAALIMMPSLQAWGGLYAIQMTANAYPDTGFLVFDIYKDGHYECHKELFALKTHIQSPKFESRITKF